jgi:oxygen-independent coproporphyrinogen-3 oxidase
MTPLFQVHPALRGGPYQGYVYAYPHKTAYRRLDPPRPLREVWAAEPRSGLFLYVHVPFCSMRCGFCNLFTTPNPRGGLVALYLDALRRQAETVRAALPEPRFARFAVGGGTPTFLGDDELSALFEVAEQIMGADLGVIPAGIEASPDTLTASKVALLKARGVGRVSLGIQSFVESEAAASGRPQSRREVDAALALLAAADFPTVNLDLIYGLPGQTVQSWLYSVREALAFAPDELYLYPLYVRPLTGLGRVRQGWDDIRPACYREGRDLLLAEGYEQVSMRMFRRPGAPSGGPAYCCQEDGMVGLGCGARSYTRGLHYALDYAVGPKGVKTILADYVARGDAEFSVADRGFVLDADEQRRRYLLQSVLNVEGLDTSRYAARFGSDPADDFPDLRTFADLGLPGIMAAGPAGPPTFFENPQTRTGAGQAPCPDASSRLTFSGQRGRRRQKDGSDCLAVNAGSAFWACTRSDGRPSGPVRCWTRRTARVTCTSTSPGTRRRSENSWALLSFGDSPRWVTSAVLRSTRPGNVPDGMVPHASEHTTRQASFCPGRASTAEGAGSGKGAGPVRNRGASCWRRLIGRLPRALADTATPASVTSAAVGPTGARSGR